MPFALYALTAAIITTAGLGVALWGVLIDRRSATAEALTCPETP